MLSKDFLQSLSEKAAELFPDASDMKADLQQRLYTLMQGSFEKLNLVTREEFDAQTATLRRAEAAIADLEQTISELETRHSANT